MSVQILETSGEALEQGVTRALAARVDGDYWQRLETEDALASLDADLWLELVELGLPTLMLPAEAGGGASLLEAHGAVAALAALSVPAPAAETMLANWLAVNHGLPTPHGIATLGPVAPIDALSLQPDGAGFRVTGQLRALPFARHADALVADALLAGVPQVCVLRGLRDHAGVSVTPGTGLHGEARDTLDINLTIDAQDVAQAHIVNVWTAGAALRAVQMAESARAAMDLSIQYVMERQQFGRPLAKFQAIQQQLAVMAAEVTLACVAARRAFSMLSANDPVFAVASAKATAGLAASRSAAIAHQVHGAMGFTAEYGLHRHTRRLWAWREEYGNEAWWNAASGERIAAAGADALWDMLIDEPV